MFDFLGACVNVAILAGGMAAALGYTAAFTSAQWKELERQAMIYKYMVASVPVPPHLLLPTSDSSAPHSPLGSGCGIFNLKFVNNKDPELGRCKRTDGKKWRCSRDVVPHQKYCERHMHRGRPRSRKPVEVPPNNKKTRLHLPTHTTPTPKQLLRSTIPPNEIHNSSNSLLLNSTKTSEHMYVLPYREQSNRGLEWMMEGEMVTMDTSEQQWQQLMTERSIYSTSAPSIFQQSCRGEEPMNLLSLPDIVGNSPNDEYNLFLNSYHPPRDFIDAWSNDGSNNENYNNQSSVTVANGNLSPSSLNLSMAMSVGNSLDNEIGQIQMGFDVARATKHHHKSQVSSWLNPVSTPGGPLAEVLRPSSVAIGSNPGSPCRGNDGDVISRPTTSASSASGVIQRTILSLSDSSVSNSPTLAATSAAAPEIVALQWLS